MYTATKNSKKLKALYQQCLSVKSAIPHPRIMGVIRECGGKMHMSEKEWDQAQTDFFESFRNYDEAGSVQRIQVLKYLVLANMLMESQINPFDSQETKPYKNDPQIVAMTNLVSAYQRRDIREFEKILRDNRATIMDDPFIRDYIDDVLKNIRTQVLIRLIKPYTRIEIPFISRQLNIPAQDVEDLLVGLILDKKIAGHIDQVNQRLELQRQYVASSLLSLMTVTFPNQSWRIGVTDQMLRLLVYCSTKSIGRRAHSDTTPWTSGRPTWQPCTPQTSARSAEERETQSVATKIKKVTLRCWWPQIALPFHLHPRSLPTTQHQGACFRSPTTMKSTDEVRPIPIDDRPVS